jgi:hypothetical protein
VIGQQRDTSQDISRGANLASSGAEGGRNAIAEVDSIAGDVAQSSATVTHATAQMSRELMLLKSEVSDFLALVQAA